MTPSTTHPPTNQAANGQTGGPADAATAFEAALLAAAKAPPSSTADPAVSLAFALGWQMAELFAMNPDRRSERHNGDLPGLGSLSDANRREIFVDQIQVALTQLTPRIQKGGLTSPTAELDGLRAALATWPTDGPAAIETLHRRLLGTLTAADFRLGKGYGLGRALADTCEKASDVEGVKAQLHRHRVANVLAWLDELSTALPAHAAHSVYASLSQWRDWAASEALPREVTAGLKRQGELWRALLSGEKRGTDILEIDNYLRAAGDVAQRAHVIAVKTLKHLWWLTALIAVLILVAIGLFIAGGTSHVVAGTGTLIAALGLSWKGLGGALGNLAGKLEQPVWGAVLDAAIADAVTLKPGNVADALGRTTVASDLRPAPDGLPHPPTTVSSARPPASPASL